MLEFTKNTNTNTNTNTKIPVKLLVLPAIYDNVDTGVDDKEEVGQVGQEIRPEVKM